MINVLIHIILGADTLIFQLRITFYHNKYSRIQLKRLDRSRNYLFSHFRLKLNNLEEVKIKNKKKKNRNYVYYGKPFSYYYQVIEKNIPNQKLINDKKYQIE